MKKIFSAFIFLFIVSYSFGQDITTLLKLHDISIALGVANDISIFLLRAVECYSTKDYETSNYYIKKVVINFSNLDLNNLKFVVLLGSYANLKDVKQTAKYFYIADKSTLIAPENMEIIRSEIRKNFKKDVFDEALSYYYYYHARLKIIDEIKFND
ncbi:MAG: hypothetical protein HY738_15745 [Bacteroidia bacterium]|nr:hypothetical protein [Bacteroidia bacterium]